MYADRNDAPYHLQQKAGNAARWIVAVIAASGITLGALYIGSQSMGKNHTAAISEKLSKEEARRKEQAMQQAQPEARNPLESLKADSNSLIIRKGEAPPSATSKPEKQTAFTDQNYKPQGAINIVSARNFGEYMPPAPKVQQQKNPQKIIVVGKAEPRISDYCPGGEGSIMRRNCKARIELNTRNQGLSR